MALTVLAALKILHETDDTIGKYITQGVYMSAAPDSLDISQGGVLILDHNGEDREKIDTNTVQETTQINLIYSYASLEILDQYVVPWAKELFDDSEDDTGGVLSIDGAFVQSVDISGVIRMGLEAATDKLGNNIFSATIPLTVVVNKQRVRAANG